MKRFVIMVALLSGLGSSVVRADPSAAHFTGIGVFTWRETLGNALTLARHARAHNLSYVIVKSHDGVNWGTRVGGKWASSLTRDLVQAFHRNDVRVYAYFTARLNQKREHVLAQVGLAKRALDLGADGLIADDLFLFGASRKKVELYFSELRKLVDSRPGTVLAFSAFPHLMRHFEEPWDIAMKYSTYFLTQSYWHLFRQRDQPRMTPEKALAYTQANWDALRAYFPGYTCTLIPVGQSYGNVTDAQIDRFLARAYPYYRGVAFFRWDTMPKGGWNKLKVWGGKYATSRRIQDPSLISKFDPSLETPAKWKGKIAKPKKSKKGKHP